MLPVEHRLRRRAEFAAAVRAGRRVCRGSLVVHLVPGGCEAVPGGSGTPVPEPPGICDISGSSSPACSARTVEDQPVRVGFVIPRAVGCAVDRNRVRRRLRHLLRDRLATLPPGTALVVRVLPGAPGASFTQLAAQLDAALAAAASATARGPGRGPGRGSGRGRGAR